MTSKSLTDTDAIAANFIATINVSSPREGAEVIALSGDLGSGKTTFTKAVARVLGIEEAVTSPTFVIEKIYAINTPRFKKFVHIDAYRLEKSSELMVLGWKEIVEDPQNLIFIEWAEKVIDILPTRYTQITFTHIDETTRDITIESI